MWMGIGYNIALLALAVVDYYRLGDSKKCTVSREQKTHLSIGEQNAIWISAAHDGNSTVKVQVVDEPPIEFDVVRRDVSFTLNPRESERKEYRVRPDERGDYMFGDVNARYYTALGLLTRQERIPSEMAVKVYPDIFQTNKHRLLSRENRTSQMGLRRSRILGQGQEFERLREYVPDDSIRDIDWKATARLGIPITREYDVEQSQNIMILLDIGRNMASRTMEADGKLGITKADCAINASVLLAHVATQSDDRVGLFCFAREPVSYIPPGKGLPQASRLLDALYLLKPRLEEPSYYENFSFVGAKQKKRSLIFLFTDLIDSEASSRLISSVGLLAKKHLVVCVALADYELSSIIEAKPENTSDLYTQAVALGMVHERKKALSQLARQGVIAMDATPSDLSIAAVNKYLQIKREARL